jgi:ferredoxin/flavodoxin---NADP+ reductase
METSSNLHFSSTVVIENRALNENTWLISLRKNFSFIPGQCVSLTLDFSINPRLYSIASGIYQSTLDIIYKVYSDGLLTPKLNKLQKGDTVYCSDPFGTFTCDDQPAVWIAAGTGVAPFASMVFSGNTINKTLIHGGRTIGSFFFAPEFIQQLGKNYIRCSSGELGDGIFIGRLTSYLSSLETFNPDEMYYLCGSSEMVVETRDILINKGIPINRIMAEIYF